MTARVAVASEPIGTPRREADGLDESYLKDIGTVSLLTAKQEVELAKRIQDLMYLDGVRATLAEELEREDSEFEWAIAANIQEEELERRLEDGKRAKNQMIQPTCGSWCRSRSGREQVDELQDLIQEVRKVSFAVAGSLTSSAGTSSARTHTGGFARR